MFLKIAIAVEHNFRGHQLFKSYEFISLKRKGFIYEQCQIIQQFCQTRDRNSKNFIFTYACMGLLDGNHLGLLTGDLTREKINIVKCYVQRIKSIWTHRSLIELRFIDFDFL